ncbi:D-glycero-alpha-D-manno-heptose-1,7-bisphosphate 7-phosphatase [Microbacterium sp. USHLN186]|uniref:D-glycero-alpha-D-manno-heptose-1,7-bisphosphate 7-phosphatase n=1 Tax=Microbacterium sp. USHLN186 TaxID=3081286 RepID=UPI003018EF37
MDDSSPRLRAILFDRDDTLIEDVPYNGDPDRVRPMPHAREALQRARRAGLRTGVLSNQSGIARGILTVVQVEAVNAQVERMLGPFDVWRYCPHGPDDGCRCRKPQPGMIRSAAGELGLCPAEVAMIGDIGADVEAAAAAGARGVLVPTSRTRPDEVQAAAVVVPDLVAAVALLLEDAGGLS